MTCGCEYGPKCTTVRRCVYEDLLADYKRELDDNVVQSNTTDLLYKALDRCLSWLTSYPGGGTMGENGPHAQAVAALKSARGEK